MFYTSPKVFESPDERHNVRTKLDIVLEVFVFLGEFLYNGALRRARKYFCKYEVQLDQVQVVQDE